MSDAESWRDVRLSWFWPGLAGACVGGCVLVAITLIVGLSGAPSWVQLFRLASDGRRAVATVTSINRSDHDDCYFTFKANRRTFTNSQPCGADTLGPITIVYDPGDPTVVDTGSPASDLIGSMLLALLATFVFGFMGASGARAVQRGMLGASQDPSRFGST
jgi:hypothetical protein